MKRYPLLILALFLVFNINYAQSKLDIQGQIILKELHNIKAGKTPQSLDIKLQSNSTILSIIDFSSSDALDEAQEMGAVVRDVRGDLAIVEIPIEKLGDIADIPTVNYISTNKKAEVQNDLARTASMVDEIRKGVYDETDNDTKYFDGTGVVVGIMDTGLDPNHINFKDKEGNSRVKGITLLTGYSGNKTRYSTPSEISSFTTDSDSSTHGTHVLGTITGSYIDDETDFSGIAPAADIYIACGELYTYNIILGVIDIIDYAETNGKTAVINLSVGSNGGSHDQFDYYARYLDNVVKSYYNNPIVVVAAGNEAGSGISIVHQFTKGNTSFTTAIGYDYSTTFNASGMTEFYSDSSTKIKVTPIVYSAYDGEIIATLDKIALSNSAGGYTDVYSAEELDISSYFSGNIYFTSNYDYNSSRFYVQYRNTLQSLYYDAYNLGFKVEGMEGHSVYCYHNGTYSSFTDCGDDNLTPPTDDGTINNLACGLQTFCVGSYNTRRSWTTISGNQYYYPNIIVDEISPFSSWGTLYDGRNLPHIVAPGSVIISSMNNYYSNRDDSSVVKEFSDDNRSYQWMIMQGTSMATPHVCGIVALWKQLKPDLTIEEAIEAAQLTATNDQYTGTVQSGAGKINAEKGLYYIMGHTSIDRNDENGIPNVITYNEGFDNILISTAQESPFTATLFSTSGNEIFRMISTNGKGKINTSSFPKGIYILNINGERLNYSRKIVIK